MNTLPPTRKGAEKTWVNAGLSASGIELTRGGAQGGLVASLNASPRRSNTRVRGVTSQPRSCAARPTPQLGGMVARISMVLAPISGIDRRSCRVATGGGWNDNVKSPSTLSATFPTCCWTRNRKSPVRALGTTSVVDGASILTYGHPNSTAMDHCDGRSSRSHGLSRMRCGNHRHASGRGLPQKRRVLAHRRKGAA